MQNSQYLVSLALKNLDCSQKDLAERLGVSAGQISKWKKHGEYMSGEIEKKLNQICKVGDLPAELILKFGSVENATKWDELFRYLANLAAEEGEGSYDCYQLRDFDSCDMSLIICGLLDELGVVLPQEAPKVPDYDDDAYDHDFFEFSHVKIINAIFESFIGVNDFFTAYFAGLGNSDNTLEAYIELESCLLELATCKVDLDPKVAPNFTSFKYKWLQWYEDKISEIKYKAVQSNEPLREELMKLVTETAGQLLNEAEREVLGWNKGQLHPDIYMHELLQGMRMIRKLLPAILEKLDIKLSEKDLL